ncbi:MAG: hypothetical protein HQL52_11370 [Magnetococcales bacterium]|nr:hypothetical protein [Magnetococcales bacterium]
MDKTSVRAEIDRLKAEFDALRSSGKVSDEIQALMASLLLIVDLILSIFLEKQTRKTSKNSSIPPSQTDKDDTTPAQGRGKGLGF